MKICLIGSTRFKNLYIQANKELTAQGHIVYTIAWHSSDSDSTVEVTPEQKEVLDLVHLRKIAESDAVMVVTDETGYFGDSTRRELIWAQMLEKPIMVYGDMLAPAFEYPSAEFLG